MKKVRNYYPLFALIFIFILGIWFSYSYFPTETKTNVLTVFVTFLVGILVVYLYIKQKEDAKRDAAKIILQEIRRAEDIISDYKQSGGYQFAKKIIATNSWSKNIHLFVGDLDNDELDKISDLYSTGEYLDNLIKEISKITLDDEIEREKKLLEIQLRNQQQITLEGSTYPIAQISQSPNVVIMGVGPVWKNRLNTISFRLEPIYNSTIALKLKRIAGLI